MNIDEKLHILYSEYEKLYVEKTKRSRELHEKARRYTPAGVTYAIRHYHPYPLYIARAKGTRVWDIDGNEYIDFWMGHGVHILGHLPEVVVESIKESLEIGTHLGFEHPYVVEYMEFLTKIIPGLEQLRFTNSGTEANTYAVRLARAYTKRKYIVKMEGGWHGSSNNLHIYVKRYNGQPESAGFTEEAAKYTIAIPFNNPSALEDALRKYDVAGVILEPVMGAAGCIEPDKDYLREVRRLTQEYGALLIFDEVITGFRLAPGGAQEYYGVKADIITMGKALGGGAGSVGAFGGNSELMNLLDQTKRPPSEFVFHGGTFVANPVVVRAGYALAKYLHEHRTLYEEASNLWNWFRRRVSEECSEASIPCWTTGEATLTGIHFTRKRPRNARESEEYRWSRMVEKTLHLFSRVNNILYISESKVHFLPSLVHSREEVEKLLWIFTNYLEQIKKLNAT
jgi:glutamate-1-semialdehyde 2,1-aminomutase